LGSIIVDFEDGVLNQDFVAEIDHGIDKGDSEKTQKTGESGCFQQAGLFHRRSFFSG
jgi:hypothetical protein